MIIPPHNSNYSEADVIITFYYFEYWSRECHSSGYDYTFANIILALAETNNSSHEVARFPPMSLINGASCDSGNGRNICDIMTAL